MLNLFKSIFKHKPNLKLISEDASDDSKYPPPADGFPVKKSEQIVADQKQLIDRIRQFQDISGPLFDELVMPVIQNLAAYIHLLPASEYHHHNKKGGLFRHSLEAGLYALQMAKGCDFCADDWPAEKHDKQRKWRLAAFLAGLLHDLGKPYIDYYVISESGIKWQPSRMGIEAWIETNGVQQYYLEWKNNRGKKHEQWAPHGMLIILTNEIKDFLGDEIYDELYDSVVAQEIESGRLTTMLVHGDETSIKQDVVKDRVEPDKYSKSISSEKYLLQALRRKAKINKENIKGSYFWVLKSGLYISWESAVNDALEMLKMDNIMGIQNDPNELARILLERGFAEYLPSEGGKAPKMFWHIYPEPLQGVGLKCLKISSMKTIYTGEPPTPVEGIVLKANGTPFKQSLPENIANNMEDIKESNEPENCDENKSNSRADIEQKEAKTEVKVVKLMDEALKNKDRLIEEEDAEDHRPAPQILKMSEIARQLNDQNTARKPDDKKSKTPINSAKSNNENKQPVVAEKQTSNDAVKAKQKPLPDTAGWAYISKAVKLKTVIEKMQNGDFAIRFPDAAKQLDKPADVMNTLFEEGLLKTDAGESKTNMILGKKYLLLNEQAANYIESQAGCYVVWMNSNSTKANTHNGNSNASQKGAAKNKNHQKNASSEKETQERKTTLPENTELIQAFLSQVMQGYGEFIGDIEIKNLSDNESTIYQIPGEVLGNIAQKTGLSETAVKIQLKKIPSLTIDGTKDVITLREND